MMSTQDAGQKERNFDDADKFLPERWLKPESQEYHAFASIPFGVGARKCLGQNIAETMMTMLAIKVNHPYCYSAKVHVIITLGYEIYYLYEIKINSISIFVRL